MSTLLIEMQYLGTVSYYQKLLSHPRVLIEAHENFEKSTYRNRCCIHSPEGKLRLSIPLEGGRGQRQLYSEIKIGYDVDWQKNHWNSLVSCYRNSPYFEYYEERFFPFYAQRFEKLFDFNRQLMDLTLELLEVKPQIAFTESYEKHHEEKVEDCRSEILPSKVSLDFPVKYRQVFEERTGFIPDLSIVDLLFSKGPHAAELLRAD